MKVNLEQNRKLLEDDNSPYFCGSSCLLSLLMVVKEIEQNSVDFTKAFPELESLILALFDEDPILFDLSKKKELLSDEEWKKAMSIFDDYAEFIENMNELIRFCTATHKERYLSFLKDDWQFMVNIVSYSLDGFINREDKPEEFLRHMNNVLSAVKKEF